MSVSAAGLAFVAAALLSLVRIGLLRRDQVRSSIVRDAFFLVALVGVALQLVEALAIVTTPDDADAVDIDRDPGDRLFPGRDRPGLGAGRRPVVRHRHEVTALVRGQRDEADEDTPA